MTKVVSKIIVPSNGEKITVNADNTLNVPHNPIIPFIEGDGIGVDITPPQRYQNTAWPFPRSPPFHWLGLMR